MRRSSSAPTSTPSPSSEDEEDVKQVNVQRALLQPAQSREAVGPACKERLVDAARSTDRCSPTRDSPCVGKMASGATVVRRGPQRGRQELLGQDLGERAAPCTACDSSARRSRSPRSRRSALRRVSPMAPSPIVSKVPQTAREQRPMTRVEPVAVSSALAVGRAAQLRHDGRQGVEHRCGSDRDDQRAEGEEHHRPGHPSRGLVRVRRGLAARMAEQGDADESYETEHREPADQRQKARRRTEPRCRRRRAPSRRLR